MKEIESFTFFRSYHESLKNLNDRDRKQLLVAIVDYIFDDITPDFKGNKKSVWCLIEPHLNSSKTKAGNARKKSNQNQNEIKSKSNQKQNSNSVLLEKENKKKNKNIEIEIESEKENKKKDNDSSSDFVAPTLADIISYAKKLNLCDENYCERFYNYYEAIGWVNSSGRKIKKWKLVFSNWLKGDELKQRKKTSIQKSKLDSVFDKFMEGDDD